MSTKKIQIEFISHHYGRATLSFENSHITGSRFEIADALKKASNALLLQYVEGCNIFYVTKKQLEIIKEHFLNNG